MAMSRKDYELIAGVFRDQRALSAGHHATDRPDPDDVLDELADRLGRALKADNGRFDPDRFYKATGAS